MAIWFRDFLFWSAQVALLVAAAAVLPRVFRIQQPRVLLAYWRALLVLSLALPVVQPWQHVSFRLEANGQVAFPDSRVLPPPATNVAHWHLSMQEIAWIVCAVIVIGILTIQVIVNQVSINHAGHQEGGCDDIGGGTSRTKSTSEVTISPSCIIPSIVSMTSFSFSAASTTEIITGRSCEM